MNKHLYRIVFNRALGVLQVVAEISRRPGSSGSSAGSSAAAALAPVSFALWLALGWVGVVEPATAQQAEGERQGRIVADHDAPGQHRSTVLETRNGVPLVNITTPSDAGVSRNIYSQFDVGPEGAILNNSRGQVQTQLGGGIDGNPWLAAGTARVILNEVNSADPSYLSGYVEVAGTRAEVVIANPAGIQVEGGGFLNASRATLTTGTPILEQGALTGYGVERGTIRVTGAGLDATHTDYTDLIARSLEVNAGIWARELQVTAGVNNVSADHTQVIASAGAVGGSAPTLALDVSALGGMYAGKIALLGTEHGVGVRNAGEVGASAGELVVTVDGRLENTGALQSRTDTRVNASDGIVNSGTLSAARELAVATPRDLDNTGTLNARRIDIAAASLRNRGGTIEQTGLQQLKLQADRVSNRDGGRIGVTVPDAPGTVEGNTGGGTGGNVGGDIGGEGQDSGGTGTDPGGVLPVPLANGVMDIAGELDNDGGGINAGGGVELLAANGLDNRDGHLGLQRLMLAQGELDNSGGELSVSGDAQLHADWISNDGGRLEVAGRLEVDAGALSNRAGTLAHSGLEATAVQVAGTLDNTAGTLASNAARLTLEAGSLVNETGRIEHAGTNGLEVSAGTLAGAGGTLATAGAAHLRADQIDHGGATLSATQVILEAAVFDNRGGRVVATGPAASTLLVQSRLDNGDGGLIASSGDLRIETSVFGNAGGVVQHAGDGALSIEAATLEGAGGTIAGNGSLGLIGEGIDLRGGTISARQVTVDAGELTTADGTLLATGDGSLQLQVRGTLDNDGGTVATNGALDLVAGSVRNRDGQIQAAGPDAATVQVAGTFDNTRGTLALAGDTSVTAAELLNAGGLLQAADDSALQFTVDRLLDNSAAGTISAGGDLTLMADTLDNTAGRIEHAGQGDLAIDARALEGVDGTIASNGTLRLTGQTTNLQRGTTQAQSITIDTGSLTTADGTLVGSGDGPLQLRVRESLDNDRGVVATNGALQLSAGAVSNRDGTLQAAGDPTRVQVAGTFDNTGGTLASAGDTTVTATAVDNTGGLVQAMDGSTLAITVDGLLDNSDDGVLASDGDMALTASALDNTAGRIEHAGDGTLNIDANQLGGAAGTIASNGALTLTGDATDLHGGTTSAQSIVIDTGDLTTAVGSLIASGDGPLRLQIQGAWDNDGGTAATNGMLDLAAGTVSNRDGLIQVAGGDPTSLNVAGTFDNRGGTLAVAGDTTVVADELRNAGGTLQVTADSTLQLSVDGLLDNSSEGLITAGGDLSLTAATLDNTSGRVEHAGDGQLAVDATTLEGTDGTIASNGALALTGETTNLSGGTTQAQSIAIDTGTLTTADGTLIAGGDGPLRLQVRDALDNDRGTIATNGTLDLVAGSVTNRDGLVQSAGADPGRVQVTGRFDNSAGTLAMAGDLTLTADTLDNNAGRIEHAGEGTLALTVRVLDGVGGTVLSNGALDLVGETLDLRDGETMANRITVDAGTLGTAGGAFVASGTDTLALNVRDTFDNTAGTVAGNGGLILTAGSTLNRDGLIQVSGGDPALMQVAGTLDNTGGTIATVGATTLHAGELLNVGGTVQAASDNTLQITADGRLVSDDGVIEGNGDIALQAQSLANNGGTVATAGAVDATVTGALDNSGGSLVAGEDLTIQAGTLLNRDTLDADGQQGLFGAAVTLGAAILDNTRGRIGAGEGLILTATDLVNAAGVIDANGNLAVTATGFDNAAGTLVQRGAGELVLDVTDTIANTADGLIGAEGAATLQTGALDNTGGTVFARGTLGITSDGNVLNRAGGLLQSNAGMTVSAGGVFDNSAGSLDATGAATVEAARIANVGGQLLAGEAGDTGSALSLASTGALDNRGGTVGSRGGDLLVDTTSVDNRSDGVLVAARDLTLAAGAVDNSAGTVYATRHLRYESSAGTLNNNGGQFGAGDTAWLDLARIDNTDDGRIQAGTLWLTAAQMDNAGGEAGADVMHAQIGTMTGSGRLYAAQWLDLVFSGDFTYSDGEQLESGDRLDLTVGGTFTNHGTLESAGSLNLAAGNVLNTGTINASNDGGTGVNHISASGTIDNRAGASIEGDTVELSARDVTNTGDIVGDVVGIEADTVTNGRDLGAALAARDYGEGFIGAAEYLELRVGQRLSNRDGEIFSGGDLVIGGRTDGTRTRLLENISGRIQSEGDLSVAADRIENVRRVLEYQQRPLTPAEQAEMAQVLGSGTGADTYGTAHQDLYEQYCREDMRTRCIEFDLFQYTERGTPLEGLFVTRASAGSVLASGGDMTLQTTALLNRHSAVAAGETLVINGSGQGGGSGESAPGVVNESLAGEQTWDVTGDYWLFYQRCDVDLDCAYEPREVRGTFDYGSVTRMVYPEQGRATITAGDGVLIVSDGDVANTVVNVSDGLDIGTGTVGGPGSTALGAAGQASAGTVAAVGPATGGAVGDLQDTQAGAVSPGVAVGAITGEQATAPDGALEAAAEWINSTDNPINAAPQLVGTPERPLPGLVPPDNGMFDQNTDPDARFVVTTAPRFVPDDTIGSDYLTGQLGAGTNLHKRLGDNYYEQRMVLEQILQLTGRRTLDGNDALSQYRTLMDNAAQTATGLGLVLGAPLTSVQIAALDHDIVWLVEQVIDSQTVLVPVVYLSKATAERLRADGALIAADNVDIRSAATVRNDGTMSATQGMWLSADTLINDGTMDAGQRLVIATTGDTLSHGRLSGGAVTVNAGRDVRNAGAIVARDGGALVQAGRDFVQTATGSLAAVGSAVVNAGRDLRLDATTVTASEHLVLGAGRDLSVTAKTGVRTLADGHTVATRQTLQATELQAGGNLMLQAGRVATLQAAQLQAGGAVAIAAGRDLQLSTLTTTDTSLTDINGRRFKQRTETLDETVHGTIVQAGGGIAMTAGRDATLTAAQVVSDAGGIAIAAGRDLTLATAEETHHFERDTVRKKSGLLSSKTTTTHDEVTDTYAIGTTLSGEAVDLAAGRDFTATAAQVVGTGDVAIVAVRDVTIDAGQNTRTESHSSQHKTSGLFGNGGLSVTLGSRRSANTIDGAETSHTGSMVGSLEGDTVIVAGEDVTVRGSTVASPEGDIAMYGRSINIEEVYDTSTYRQTSRSKQSGLTLAVSVPVVEAALAAYDSSQSVGESDDSRVNAMAAANAGYDTYQAAGTAASAMSSGEVVNVSLTVGSQQSSYQGTGSSREALGSSINAGGRVDITATGAGVDSGIRISGSDVHGGTGASLHADGAIDILAAQNTYEHDSENGSSGWNVGVAATGGSGGWAFGITAGVNKGQGDSDGQTATHTNAYVGSDGTTTLTSGGTTTLRGGQITGKRFEVDADALAIESLQDTETYESRQQDASVQVTVGWGASVSGNYSQSNVDSGYASVTEQSGILAGDGGYAINVRNNTDLTGGIITSTEAAETAGRNSFSTGTLTISELENHADYDGSAFGVSGSVGVNGNNEQGQHQAAQGSGNGQAGGTSANKSFGFGRDGDSQHSLTASGINTHNITITDSAGQAATGRTVDEIQVEALTSTTTDQLVENSGALDNGFDAAAVQKELDVQVQVTQAFDHNRQEAKTELYAHGQAKADEARAIRMANGGVDTEESTRLDEEAARIKETAMWLDVAAMAVFAGPDTGNISIGETLTQVDLVRRTATPDAKIVLQSCEANGQNCVSREVDMDQVAVKDGKIYIFNNGIFNSEDYALATGAKQNSNEASAQGVYYILNPETGNAVAEVLYAGYDKINDLLGGALPLTGAGRANQAIIDIAIQRGGEVNSVNHSRGSLTWTNVMHDLDRQGKDGLPIGNVFYNGAAANAQEAADLLRIIGDAGKLFQSTHATDLVGSWIGGNPVTGGESDGSFPDSHSSYTGYLPSLGTLIEIGDTRKYVDLREITDRNWGDGNYSVPQFVAPTQPQKENEDEGGG